MCIRDRVWKRSFSVTVPPRTPGTRAHATTTSRCTSNPATRSWICSTAPPSAGPTTTCRGGTWVVDRIWGSCSQRQFQVPRTLRQTCFGLKVFQDRDGDRARQAAPSFHLSGWPAGSCSLVPLAGAGRQVGDGDRQCGVGGEGGEFDLPGPDPGSVGATTVGADQQPAGARVAGASDAVPPGAQGRNRDLGRVVVGPDADPAGARGHVIDAVGDGLAELLIGEDVHGFPDKELGKAIPSGIYDVSA